MGRGEEEPPPDATMLMGDEVLQEKVIEPFDWSSFINKIGSEQIQTYSTIFLYMNKSLNQI